LPYFEYKCDKGHEFEVKQRITDDPLTKCEHRTTISVENTNDPKGDGVRIKQRRCTAPCRRQISKTNFTFKGGPPTPKYH